MTTILRRSVLGLVAVLALAACGEDDADPPAATEPTARSTDAGPTTSTAASTAASGSAATAPPTTATVDLASELGGRTYLSTAVEGFTLVDGTQISLTFDGTNIGANAGCNQLASTWSMEGDVLVVTEPAQTMMACEPAALMDQDTWLAALLTSRPTVVVDGDTMTLTAEGATVTFTDREVADPDRPLEGTTWTVESFISADAVSSVAPARAPGVVFDAGTVTVDTGCNTGSGTYTLGEGEITFGPIATTRAACPDELATQAEADVLATLTGTATYEIEADVLTLRTGDVGLGLRGAAASTGDELVGPTWTLASTIAGDATTPVAATARPATLTFDGTTVTVDTSCNTGSGSYRVDGDTITFGPVATTLIACTGAEAEVEQQVLAIFAPPPATYSFVGGDLVLGLGDVGLRFTAG